jgi:pimeloyl-ACP methyl ester carboxylesterase
MAAIRVPLFAACASLVLGCSGSVVVPAQGPGLLDSLQASVSATDNDLSPRTLLTLRRWDLETVYRQAPREAYAHLQAVAVNSPNPEVLFALAEMSYRFGRNVEKDSAQHACAYYYLCAGYAYHYLFDSDTDSPYDPRFRLACDLYNTSLGKCIRVAQRAGRLDPRQELHLPTADGKGFTLSVCQRGFPWHPEEFGPLLFCADFDVVGLANHYRSYGLGVPLIGTRVSSTSAPGHAFYPREVSFPVSAFFRFEGTVAELTQHHAGRLELYNPLAMQSVVVRDRPIPLETDLTTPLAYFLSRSDLASGEYTGFLNPAKVERKSGIYMFEPYQPGKIPVLMVHGLLSSPLTWLPMFNDLRSDPLLRERFQFWFYLYPTGNPYIETAAELRSALAELRNDLDPRHADAGLDHMVCVGHSMGGLVSKLMTVDGGDDFWRLASARPLDQIKLPEQTRAELARIFLFRRDCGIERVVFIGTPHHGSKLSPSPAGRFANQFVELPKALRQAAQDLMKENPHDLAHGLPTSVDLLAPNSPALEILAARPRPEGVHYHSIIGQAPHSDTLREVGSLLGQHDPHSDGVVPYSSAHIGTAESEIIVEADHMQVHRHPMAVLEVRRILLEHLRSVAAQNSMAATVRRQ